LDITRLAKLGALPFGLHGEVCLPLVRFWKLAPFWNRLDVLVPTKPVLLSKKVAFNEGNLQNLIFAKNRKTEKQKNDTMQSCIS
jgi:hypothetical protein